VHPRGQHALADLFQIDIRIYISEWRAGGTALKKMLPWAQCVKIATPNRATNMSPVAPAPAPATAPASVFLIIDGGEVFASNIIFNIDGIRMPAGVSVTQSANDKRMH
jgi:hypothetical protein